ncbi:outer membrane beta-barrel protein [Bacteroidota bacterium]
MKKTISVLIGLFIFSFSLGQTLYFQSGLSISKFQNNDGAMYLEDYTESLIGPSVLMGIEYLNKKHFHLSSNLGFIRKGGKGIFTWSGHSDPNLTNLNEKITIDYVTINTALELKHNITKKIIPFLSFGVRYDYLIDLSINYDYLLVDEINYFSYGIITGGGLKFNFKKLLLGIRCDYYLNFNGLSDYPVEHYGGDHKALSDKTFSLNVILGYKPDKWNQPNKK